ncbi:uncharacterized protein LOC143907513 isoform X2 [Temnothorax americanus]|uniref:uncharacterized protein LOC143907513 isoform X2 n=1 Tax=Temnothorax americanus TaxID=1964332 RepID=UPI004068AFED
MILRSCIWYSGGDLDTIMVQKKQLLEAGFEFPSNDLDSLHTQEKHISENEWLDTSTTLLLDKYATYLELVGPMKKFKNKKAMWQLWQQIAEDLEATLGIKKTYIQCENRYKTILKRKRVSDKNNSTSGSKRMKVNFENEIKKIAAIDDSVQPEISQSANKVVINVKDTPQTSNVKKNKKDSSLAQTLLKIHNEKEAKRQERHEEKMKLLKSFFEKENL